MSYKEKIEISLVPNEGSVIDFNQTLADIEKRAIDLGVTIEKSLSKSMDTFSKGIDFKLNTSTAMSQLDVLSQRARDVFKGVSGTASPNFSDGGKEILPGAEKIRLKLMEIDSMVISPEWSQGPAMKANVEFEKFSRTAEQVRSDLKLVTNELLDLGRISDKTALEWTKDFNSMSAEALNFGKSAKNVVNSFGMSVKNVQGIFTRLTGVGASAGQQFAHIFDSAKASVMKSQMQGMALELKKIVGDSKEFQQVWNKINNLTQKQVVNMDLVANGIKSVNLGELFGSRGFKGLGDKFLAGSAKAGLASMKAELRSYNEAMLATGNITARTSMKMNKAIDKMTADSVKNFSKMKGAMTALGETSSATRALFVQLTRVFIASMYIKQLSDWAEATEKLKISVLAFKTNPEYDKIADQMDRIEDVTGGAVSKLQLIPAVNKSLALGLDLTNGKLLQLVEMTTKMAQAFGTDSVQAYEDFTTAISKGSAIVLDNIGVLLRQEEAQRLEYKARNISTISFHKWRAALTQAEKRAIFMTQGIKKLREKTAELTLVQSDYRAGLTKLKRTWDEFGLAMADGEAFNIAVWGINKVTIALDALGSALQGVQFLLEKFGLSDTYKGLDSITKLEGNVARLADGTWIAQENVKFFKTNLEELTRAANTNRTAFLNLAGSIRSKLTKSVIDQLFANKDWVKGMDYVIGNYALMDSISNKYFRTLIKGNRDINTVARTFVGLKSRIDELKGSMKGLSIGRNFLARKVDLDNLVLMQNQIAGINNLSKDFNAQMSFVKPTVLFAQGLGLAVSKLNIFKSSLVALAGEGLEGWSSAIIRSKLNTKQFTNGFTEMRAAVVKTEQRLYDLSNTARIEMTESFVGFAKNLGVTRSALLKIGDAYAKMVAANTAAGKSTRLFHEYLIDTLSKTNPKIAKMKKGIEGLYEQWIKLKREAEKSNLNLFDQKIATLTDKYRDTLKKVNDLYKQISGHNFTTLFPDATRAKNDITSYYNAFRSIKEDMEGLSVDDFYVKYKVTVQEMTAILDNFGTGFTKKYNEMYETQDRFSEKLLRDLSSTKEALASANVDLWNFNFALADMDNKIERMGSFSKGMFDFSADAAQAEKMTTDHYTVLRNKTLDFFNSVQKMRDDNQASTLKSERDAQIKALDAQFGAADAVKKTMARLAIERSYINKRDSLYIKSSLELKKRLKAFDDNESADLDKIFNSRLKQYQNYADEVNRTMMKTGQFKFNNKTLNFDPKNLGLESFSDWLGITQDNVKELGDTMKLMLPKEYRSAVTMDLDKKQLEIIPSLFREMGIDAQTELMQMIKELNPAFNQIATQMRKPAEIFRSTMMDAMKDILNAVSSWMADMTFNRESAFNQFKADRNQSIQDLNKEREAGLITQAQYEEKSAAISQKYNEDKENYEKQATKSMLMGLATTFWAKGAAMMIEGGVNVLTPGKFAEGSAQLAGGAGLMSLGAALGYLGAGITTSSASSQAAQAQDRGEQDRYIIINNKLFEDKLSLGRTVTDAVEY